MVIQNNKIKRNKYLIYYPPVPIPAFILSEMLLAKPSRKSESNSSQQYLTASDISFRASTRVQCPGVIVRELCAECVVLIEVGGFGGDELVIFSWVGVLVLHTGCSAEGYSCQFEILLSQLILPWLKIRKYRIGQECLRNTSIWPYLSRDVVVVEKFWRLFLCWSLVDSKCPAQHLEGWSGWSLFFTFLSFDCYTGLSWLESSNSSTSAKYFLSCANFWHSKEKTPESREKHMNLRMEK